MTDVVVRFLADQHFRPEDTDRVEPFLQLLDRCPGEVDHLFLLGDLFDFCLGAVHIQRAGGVYADVCGALRSLVQSGVRVTFVAGNRDFLALPALAALGVEAVEESVELVLGGRRVLVCHGDVLCTADRRYQAYRRLVRSRWVRALLQEIPFFVKHGLARMMRCASQSEVQIKQTSVMEPTARALEVLRARGFDVVVCGHVHRPARTVHRFESVGSEPLTLYTLGAWNGEQQEGEVLDFLDGEFRFDFEGIGGSS